MRLVEELGCPVEHIILPTFAYVLFTPIAATHALSSYCEPINQQVYVAVHDHSLVEKHLNSSLHWLARHARLAITSCSQANTVVGCRYEHKVFVGPFSRKFPSAQVHVAPRQWSWPIPLPPQAVGIFPTSTLEDDDESTPWGSEIKQKVFAASVGEL